MSEDIQALLVRLEANATKMISETKKASKTVSDELRKIDSEFRRNNTTVSDGLTRKGRQMKESADQYRNLGFAAQNAAFQVGDFFTQVAGGTAPTRAFAQQLPQLLGGLGLIGALAGAAAAALIPLAGNLLSTGEAGDSAMKSVDTLGESMTDYQKYIQVAAMTTAELTEKFGDFAGEVRSFSEYMAGVALAETIEGLQGTVVALQAPLAGVQRLVADAQMLQEQFDRLREQEAAGMATGTDVLLAQQVLQGAQENAEAAASALGLTVDEALRLSAAIEAVGQSKGMEDIARSAGEALTLIRELVPNAYELPAPLRESVAALEELARRGAEANVDLGEMPEILSSVAAAAGAAASGVAGIGSAAAGALPALQALAMKAWEAAQARIAAENQLSTLQFQNSPGGQALSRYGSRSTPTGTGAPKPVSSGRGGGGGGGGANDVAAEAKRIFDETRTAAEKYRAEEERLGELLRSNAISQDTYSRAIDGLKEKYRDTSSALSDFASEFRSGFSDMISGVIDGSMKAEDAVRRMVTRLASMMIENQIFGLLGNLMPNVFGANGFLPLTKSAMGNVFMGGRMQAFASGGVVNGPTMFPMRGGTGLMGEAGPEAILPLTRINGSLGVRASGGGGPRTTVQVINQGGGEVREERQRGPGGDELIRITVGKQLARGDHDAAMRRYSARPAGVKR
jgi:hypothetical protein